MPDLPRTKRGREKFRSFEELIAEISRYLVFHDVKTEGGEEFDRKKRLEIAMLFDNPPSTLKEEWVTFFDEEVIPLLKTIFSVSGRLLPKGIVSSSPPRRKTAFKKGTECGLVLLDLLGWRI